MEARKIKEILSEYRVRFEEMSQAISAREGEVYAKCLRLVRQSTEAIDTLTQLASHNATPVQLFAIETAYKASHEALHELGARGCLEIRAEDEECLARIEKFLSDVEMFHKLSAHAKKDVLELLKAGGKHV